MIHEKFHQEPKSSLKRKNIGTYYTKGGKSIFCGNSRLLERVGWKGLAIPVLTVRGYNTTLSPHMFFSTRLKDERYNLGRATFNQWTPASPKPKSTPGCISSIRTGEKRNILNQFIDHKIIQKACVCVREKLGAHQQRVRPIAGGPVGHAECGDGVADINLRRGRQPAFGGRRRAVTTGGHLGVKHHIFIFIPVIKL